MVVIVGTGVVRSGMSEIKLLSCLATFSLGVLDVQLLGAGTTTEY